VELDQWYVLKVDELSSGAFGSNVEKEMQGLGFGLEEDRS
jgi:hypothetical protein